MQCPRRVQLRLYVCRCRYNSFVQTTWSTGTIAYKYRTSENNCNITPCLGSWAPKDCGGDDGTCCYACCCNAPPKPGPTPNPGTCKDFSVDEGKDCSGNDLSNSPAVDTATCCSLCSENSGCEAFTWSQYDGSGQKQATCYLKSGCPSKVPSSDCNAGSKSGPTPPGPSPPPSPSPSPPTPPPPSPTGATLYCPNSNDWSVEYGTANFQDSGWSITGGARVRSKASFNLLGGYVEFDMNTAGAKSGVNNNFYLTSPTRQNFPNYCDIQQNPGCESAPIHSGLSPIHSHPQPSPEHSHARPSPKHAHAQLCPNRSHAPASLHITLQRFRARYCGEQRQLRNANHLAHHAHWQGQLRPWRLWGQHSYPEWGTLPHQNSLCNQRMDDCHHGWQRDCSYQSNAWQRRPGLRARNAVVHWRFHMHPHHTSIPRGPDSRRHHLRYDPLKSVDGLGAGRQLRWRRRTRGLHVCRVQRARARYCRARGYSDEVLIYSDAITHSLILFNTVFLAQFRAWHVSTHL